MGAQDKNGTFELVALPKGRRRSGAKWVFALKDSGLHKARLVALGNFQKEGIDHQETFLPVIRYESLRMVLAIAVKQELVVTQMDVTTALLNGVLQEEIYMRQPEGYIEKGKEHLVLRLRKPLYGLKQMVMTLSADSNAYRHGSHIQDTCSRVPSELHFNKEQLASILLPD